ISANVFFRALVAADVNTVRVQNYGQKIGLPTADPSDPTHDLAETNQWDLGINFAMESIVLVDLVRYLPAKKGRSFPMFFPMGKDFGTVNLKINYNGEDYTVKMYPNIVHLLKNIGQGNYPKQPPKNIEALRRAFTLLETRATLFTKTAPWRFWGLRVEVSVQAESLEEAIKKVSSTPLLTPAEFVEPTDPQLLDYALRFREFTKDQYVFNLNKQIGIANRLPHFMRGTDRARTSPMQQQIIVDLYNAMGWSPGYRKISNWRTDIGWWVEDEEISEDSEDSDVQVDRRSPTPQPLVYDPTPDIRGYSAVQLYELFDKVKSQLHKLPCHNPKCKSKTASYSKDGGKNTFRLKCKHCRKTLAKGSGQERFISLIEAGDIEVDLTSP
ncbi:hypothetical protein A4X13_0g9036, partial [Tilletia indica]